MNLKHIWDTWSDSSSFSGVFSVSNEQEIMFQKCRGYRNRSEKLLNNEHTAFGIASGTKLFTGLAVCKLIDEGKLHLDDKLWDLLSFDLGEINKNVTIYQLLTHTSGIGDYIDEESASFNDIEQELLNKYPVYLWEHLEYYLQMITPLPQKFEPGARFSYSNAGFIMLGLVIEAVSKKSYQKFIQDEIILSMQLKHTGFYRMDSLPTNTALGYINDFQTNIFKLPILGGSDGGLYTCAEDLDILWRYIFSGKFFSENMLKQFLHTHADRGNEKSYGLGVYRIDCNNNMVFYAVGGDFGVDFFTAYIPEHKIVASALSNSDINTYPLLDKIIHSL